MARIRIKDSSYRLPRTSSTLSVQQWIIVYAGDSITRPPNRTHIGRDSFVHVDRDFTSLTNEAIVQLRRPAGFRERQRVIISWAHGRNSVPVSGITAGRTEKAERLDGRVLRDQEHDSSGTFLCGAAYRAAIGLVHDRDRDRAGRKIYFRGS